MKSYEISFTLKKVRIFYHNWEFWILSSWSVTLVLEIQVLWYDWFYNFAIRYIEIWWKIWVNDTTQKMKFSIKDFFSKCDQICWKLRICSHLLKRSSMENLIFCAMWRFDLKLESWRFCRNHRSSRPEVFLGKGVLKICRKFRGEYLWTSASEIISEDIGNWLKEKRTGQNFSIIKV